MATEFAATVASQAGRLRVNQAVIRGASAAAVAQ